MFTSSSESTTTPSLPTSSPSQSASDPCTTDVKSAWDHSRSTWRPLVYVLDTSAVFASFIMLNLAWISDVGTCSSIRQMRRRCIFMYTLPCTGNATWIQIISHNIETLSMISTKYFLICLYLVGANFNFSTQNVGPCEWINLWQSYLI